MPGIDLHTHSSVSDGTESPAELIAAAVAAGLDVVALTDHDSTAGWSSAFVAAEGTGITVVPGLELSTQLDYASVHVLGYLVDPENPALVAETARIRSERLHRAESMVSRIAADYALDWDDVLAQTTPRRDGRPARTSPMPSSRAATCRIARRRSRASCTGAAATTGRTRRRLPVAGVRLIAEAGGVAVIAHPGGTRARARAHRAGGCGSWSTPDCSASRSTTATTRRRSRATLDGDRARSTASSRPARATTTALGKPNRLGENTTDPRGLRGDPRARHRIEAVHRVTRGSRQLVRTHQDEIGASAPWRLMLSVASSHWTNTRGLASKSSRGTGTVSSPPVDSSVTFSMLIASTSDSGRDQVPLAL